MLRKMRTFQTKTTKKRSQAIELWIALLNLPEQEYKIIPSRRYRVDLADSTVKVAVEIHGGVYAGGRHTRGKGFENDREKMNLCQADGWTVFELSTGMIESNGPWWAELIRYVIDQRKMAGDSKKED